MNSSRILVALLALSTASFAAGGLPDAPSAVEPAMAAVQPAAHRLFSPENNAAFALNLGLRIADSALTCRNLASGGHEWVNHTQSCAGNTALIMSLVPAQIVGAWLLQRTHHYKMARIVAWGVPASDVPSVAFSASHPDSYRAKP